MSSHHFCMLGATEVTDTASTTFHPDQMRFYFLHSYSFFYLWHIRLICQALLLEMELKLLKQQAICFKSSLSNFCFVWLSWTGYWRVRTVVRCFTRRKIRSSYKAVDLVSATVEILQEFQIINHGIKCLSMPKLLQLCTRFMHLPNFLEERVECQDN